MAKKKSTRTPSVTLESRNKPHSTLVSRVSLESVRMIECHSKIQLKGDPPTISETTANALSGPAGDKILANVTITVISPPTSAPAQDSSSSMNISCVIQCVFGLDGGAPNPADVIPEETTALNQLAMFVAWPYARQFVSGITSQMGIPPHSLPLLKMDFSGVASAQEHQPE